MELSRMLTELRKDFVYMDEAVSVLHVGYSSCENVVLYGKGGHGKSQMVEKFFSLLGIKPFVKALGKGTLIDDLLGGLNIKEFQTSGKLEYFVENSFMNYEYVVLEEAFDVHPAVLEQLKDILTSGQFRNGTQVFKIKTKFIVICTNRSKQELADDDSIKALMERFPLELKVEWKEYKAENYKAMFRAVFKEGDFYDELAHVIEKVNEFNFISPRTAVKAAKIYKLNSRHLGPLRFVTGFSEGVLANIQDTIAKLKQELAVAKKFTEVKHMIYTLMGEDRKIIEEKKSAVQLFQLAKAWSENILPLLKNYKVTDNLYADYQQVIKDVGTHGNLLLQTGMSLIDIKSGLVAKTHTTIVEKLKTS